MRPPAPPRRPVCVATDLDRTFSNADLTLSPRALARAQELRRQGVTMVLATGRSERELAMDRLRPCFDAMVIEGGARWRSGGRWHAVADVEALWTLADALESEGHDVRRAVASFSVAAEAEALLPRDDSVTWLRNAERVDVTPAGVDKAFGVRRALGGQSPWLLAVGDSHNDVPLLRGADCGVAVANAVPEAVAASTMVAPFAASQGFLWSVQGLDAP